MKTQIKCLVKKGNKFIVENPEDKELAPCLIKKLLSPKKDNVEVEWVFSFESPLAKPLMGKQWATWVFGSCVKQVGLVHIFLDNVLKAYQISGFEPVEEWFSNECMHWDRKERDRAIEILTDAKCCIKKLKEGIGKLSKDKQLIEAIDKHFERIKGP